ncbi:hypothetical protein EFP25_13400, partial [Lactiplantibacillus pentosus]|nr:hypothetical protein [Lactiplantibacillus pentosus]
PDKKNFALEHCQPAPPVGKPLEWQINGHLSRYIWPSTTRRLALKIRIGDDLLSLKTCPI